MRPQTARGRRRISTRRPNPPARKANGPARRNPGRLPDVKFSTFYSSVAEPKSPPNVQNNKHPNVPKVKRDESAFTVDIHLDSTRFTALLSGIIIYAEYEISRTPGARQRAQTPAQSQRQIAPAPSGKRLSHAAHRRQKGRSGQISARGPFRIRQSRQIRRAPPRHRQPEEIAPRRGVELNSSDRSHPIFARRNFNPMARQPKPYRSEERRLIEDASGKYFVGQLTSAMVKPCQKICASISLSKTKSSEFFPQSSVSRISREKAR